MPTVMVSGSVREGTLVGLLDAVVATDPGTGGPDLRLRSLPDGHTVIAAPRELGPDAEERRTLASASGDTGINEVSDWTDPLLYAAGSGSDLTPAEIGDGDGDGGDAGPTTGRTGSTVANRDSPVLFLAWSPLPGVVFEITTTDPRRTAADLADLAGATTTVDPDEWDRLHGDR